MTLSRNEKLILRELGTRCMDIASRPSMNEKIALWRSLNRCDMQRPMVCIDQLPWNELNGNHELSCQVQDVFWRGIELELRQTIYKWTHFPADMVVEPYITIPKAILNSGYGLHAQIEKLELSPGTTAASQRMTAVLNGPDDILKIEDMRISEDTDESRARMEQADELFAGVAPVVQGHGISFHLGIWDYLTYLMNVENAYFNIVDCPDFIHACLERVTAATISGIEQANRLGLHNDIANTCHCSYVYTDELLPDCGQGKGPLSRNSWAFGMAQLFTSVSPQVTEEFELPYITRMASCFGMLYYGCCDRLDDRLDIVKKIPNIRKVSCSPWSDRERFAERLGGDLVMSVKPSPACLAAGTMDWDAVRADLRRSIDAAHANHVNLEIILKDISTVRFNPERLTIWARIAMEEVQE
jgi:hypothetical protein